MESKYWTVEHDARFGGGITAIRFKNGSRKNILRAPIAAYVNTGGDVLSFAAAEKCPSDDPRDTIFRTTCESTPMVDVLTSNGYPLVRSTGILRNRRGKQINIGYCEKCEYHASFIRRTITLNFPAACPDIYTVGAAHLVIDRSLDEYACKYSAWRARNGGQLLDSECAAYGRMEPSVYPKHVECYPFRYLSLFRRGGDAMELFPSSDLKSWEAGVMGRPGNGRFGLYTCDDPNGNTILMEPYFKVTRGFLAPAGRRTKLRGSYSFTMTIGLPMIAKRYPADIRLVGFNNRPWPDEERIRNWAEAGFNLALLDNPFHSKGDFWHDGALPPYNEDGIKEMRRVIRTAHRYGIKVIPYLSLYELHPEAKAWEKNHAKWKRTDDSAGTEKHNYWGNGEFGTQMCPASGWKKYFQSYVKKTVVTYGFDGVYFDWCVPLYCTNRRHAKGIHTAHDELLDMFEWTRNFLGADRPIIIHTSGSPLMAMESMADATIVFEDAYAPPALFNHVPAADIFPPQADMANHVQKLICPSLLAFKGRRDAKKFVANCMAMGLLSYLGGALGAGLDIINDNFRRLKSFQLRDYTLVPSTRRFVAIDNAHVRVCIFHNHRELLIVVANAISSHSQKFRLPFDPTKLEPAWKNNRFYLLTDEAGHGKRLSAGDITDAGIPGLLAGYAYAIWKLVPV